LLNQQLSGASSSYLQWKPRIATYSKEFGRKLYQAMFSVPLYSKSIVEVMTTHFKLTFLQNVRCFETNRHDAQFTFRIYETALNRKYLYDLFFPRSKVILIKTHICDFSNISLRFISDLFSKIYFKSTNLVFYCSTHTYNTDSLYKIKRNVCEEINTE